MAKRRGAATLVSYLTPSLTHSGLYKELVSLQQSIERWQQMGPDQAQDRESLTTLIREQAQSIDLSVPANQAGDPTAWIEQLQNQLLELEYALIPEGLHVMGQAPTREQRLGTLKVMADAMGLTSSPERQLDGSLGRRCQRSTTVRAVQHRACPLATKPRPRRCASWCAATACWAKTTKCKA